MLRDEPAAYNAATERGVPLLLARPLPPEARRLLCLAKALEGDKKEWYDLTGI